MLLLLLREQPSQSGQSGKTDRGCREIKDAVHEQCHGSMHGCESSLSISQPVHGIKDAQPEPVSQPFPYERVTGLSLNEDQAASIESLRSDHFGDLERLRVETLEQQW